MVSRRRAKREAFSMKLNVTWSRAFIVSLAGLLGALFGPKVGEVFGSLAVLFPY